MKTVSFTRMADGTEKEYAMLEPLYNQCRNQIPDTLFALFNKMKGDKLGYKIDRYSHSLQTATRAERDGADEETIVCALLHDIGDVLVPDNHGEVSAAILRPFINDQNYWILKLHGLFQGYYYFHYYGKDRKMRDQFKDNPYYQACVDFCHLWDQESFDPDYDTFPLEHFEPMTRRVMEEPRTVCD